MRRLTGRVVLALLVAAPLANVVTERQVAAAHATDHWERVVGEASPPGWSRYDAVEVANDGSTYLAGSFTGTFSGLTAVGGFQYFVQKLDTAGTTLWTKPILPLLAGDKPAPGDLAVDGLGNPYLRVCAPGCTLAAYDKATGNEIEAISDSWSPWPIVGASAGGLLVFSRVSGAPTALAARRLNPDLGQAWSFDLTGTLNDGELAGTWLVEAANGSFWAIGRKPGSDNAFRMVHISAAGSHLGTAEHSGGVPFDAPFATPMRISPVDVGPADHVWISVDPPTPGFDRVMQSFSLADGQLAGSVDVTPPGEQIMTPAGHAWCDFQDLEVLFGGLLSGSGAPARFSTRVLGSRLITVMSCKPISGGSPVSMMVVYSMTSRLGGGYVREAAIPFPSTATVFDVDTNVSGALVLAGGTSGPSQFLEPPTTAGGGASASRAAVSHNPTGNLFQQDEFTSLAPVRLFDTRPTEPQGLITILKNRIPTGGELKVRVTGYGGVPRNGVGSVSLNVTVTNPAAAGFITVHPCGARPLASNLNYVAGQTVANAVIAPVSAAGEVCFYSHVETDLLADVNGWFRNGGGFQRLTPVRVLDSRPGEPDGAVKIAKQRYGGSSIITVRVGDVPGVPADASAVSLNVTVTEPVDSGFVTVYPCGDRPLASNLNYVTGQTVPNAVIAPLGADSVLCFYAHTDAHLIADINGYFGSTSSFRPVPPKRMFDTRVGEPDGAVPVDKHQYGGLRTLTLKVTGAAGVPATGVGAVSLNVTATNPIGPGFVTVFPCGQRPLASNVNFVAGGTAPNAVLTPVSSTGQVCFYSHTDTDLIADVNGWFPA